MKRRIIEWRDKHPVAFFWVMSAPGVIIFLAISIYLIALLSQGHQPGH